MSGMASFISWWSLTGVRPTVEDLHATLAKYQAGAVLAAFARISAKMRTWENSPTVEMDREMVARNFSQEWTRRIESQRSEQPNSLVFHRITILYLLKEALQHCRPDGQVPNSDGDAFALAECFLQANDLVL